MAEASRKFGNFTHMLKTISKISDRWHAKVNLQSGGSIMPKGLQINKDEISREIFFICKKCAGPLIQYTFCCICKKTASRKCVKCDSVRTEGDHRKCLRVMFIEMEKTGSK